MKVNLQYSILTPEPGTTIPPPSNTLTSRRKDSVTSTQSMPSSDLGPGRSKSSSHISKSKSLTPLANTDPAGSPTHTTRSTDALDRYVILVTFNQ